MPAISDHGVTELLQSATKQPAQQSAVEWVRENLGIAGNGTTKYYALDEHDAFALARRCDEAADKLGAAVRNSDANLERIMDLRAQLARRCDEAEQRASARVEYHKSHADLRSQLAAAQARADLAEDNARQSREEIEALKGEIAAAQQEATALRVSWENAEARERELREALVSMQEYYKEHMITGRLYRQVEDALAKHKEAL